jgi:hypothetical protein
MFFVGTFVTVVSILRLKSLMKYASSTNVTWDNIPVAIWSTIELNVGMMCTSLPTVRLLAVRIWPIMNGSTIRSRFGYSGSRYGRSRYPKRATDLSSSGDGPVRMNSLKISDLKANAVPMSPGRVSDVRPRPATPESIQYGLALSRWEVPSVHTFTSRHKMHKYSTSVPIRSEGTVRREFFEDISERPTTGRGRDRSRHHHNTLGAQDSSVTERSARTRNSTIGKIVETYATMSSPADHNVPLSYPAWPLNEPDNLPLPRWLPEQRQTMFPIGETTSSSSDGDNEGTS